MIRTNADAVHDAEARHRLRLSLAMKTSSSDGTIGRMLDRRQPAACDRRASAIASAASRRRDRSRRAGDRRTPARSRCRAAAASVSSASRGDGTIDLEQRARSGWRAGCAGLIEREHLALRAAARSRAALGFVEVRRRHQDGDALARGTATAASRTRGATPDRRPSSARRAGSPPARGPACRPARASASCRRTADRRAGRGTCVSCVISSRRSRRAW